MMETLFRGFDDFFWGLSAWFAHSPESLLELETPDSEPNTLALGTGGLATGFDLAPGGEKARKYEPGIVPDADGRIATLSPPVDSRTTWHEIRDALFDRGHLREAEPTLEDAAGIVMTPALADLYRPGTTRDIPDLPDLPAYFWRCLVEAIGQDPLLAHPTAFDIGEGPSRPSARLSTGR